MKKQLFVILLTLFSISAISQTNTLLTKEETINYINKKVKEAKGFDMINFNGVSEKVLDCGFKKSYSGENIECIEIKGKYSYLTEFNPAHIKMLTEVNLYGNQVVGCIAIDLIGKTAKFSSNFGLNESRTQASIIYLKSDPDNYKRISKALLHLRDLYKAEDDPFDN